jgi:hypothetical protein
MAITSRNDGKLVISTKKLYKVAVQGQLEERNILVCKDITTRTEYIAADLEQFILAALMNITAKNKGSIDTEKTQEDKEKEAKQLAFYKDDNPSDSDIEENANALFMLIMMNTEIKISQIMQTFAGIINEGLIETENGTKVNQTIWNTIDRNDKYMVMVKYCCFFVNPLQRLSSMSVITASPALQGQLEGNVTQ